MGVGVCVRTSCEVRWMMLNPGRYFLVGRWCYVESFVVVYRRGVGGCNNVMLKNIKHCKTQCENNIFHRHQKNFMDAKIKKM